jgi:leucyl aminopeptidase (aminopeptidase T)
MTTVAIHDAVLAGSRFLSLPLATNDGTSLLEGDMMTMDPERKKMAPIRYDKGRLVEISGGASARLLSDYIESFGDPRMRVAGELGIGLNEKAHCAGRSYIEDESSYGTFHIGMGRNISLGGKHYANGHFDLIAHQPDVWVDGTRIMEHGIFSLT